MTSTLFILQNQLRDEANGGNNLVLDVKEEISKLDILYDSVSIKKTKRNLRIITVKIQNIGNENLTQNYYDTKSPIGFEIKNADLVQKPQVIDYSNEYFREQITLDIDSLNQIFIPSIIIDKGEFFSIKILSLVSDDISPEIIPKGYLSGIGTPNLKISLNEEKIGIEKGFWRELISGNLIVHFVRFLMYFFIMIIFIFLLFVPYIEFNEKRSRQKRKKMLINFNQ